MKEKGFLNTAGILIGVVGATVTSYLGWLGWHPDRQSQYHVWQVVGLAASLLLIASIGGWLGRRNLTVFIGTSVLVAVWSIDHSYRPGPESMWPVGAISLAIASVIGLGLAAWVGEKMQWVKGVALRRSVDRARSRRPGA